MTSAAAARSASRDSAIDALSASAITGQNDHKGSDLNKATNKGSDHKGATTTAPPSRSPTTTPPPPPPTTTAPATTHHQVGRRVPEHRNVHTRHLPLCGNCAMPNAKAPAGPKTGKTHCDHKGAEDGRRRADLPPPPPS